MPKTEQHHINLPPARLSLKQIEEIDDALPPYFQGELSWIVWIGNTRIEEYTIADFCKSIEDVKGITEFGLSVEVEDDITLELICEEKGSSLEYSCPTERAGEMQRLARGIEGIFRDNRRLGWWIPLICAPKLELGEQPKPRIKLSWNRIAENVITNWLSYIVISVPSMGIGYLIGIFL